VIEGLACVGNPLVVFSNIPKEIKFIIFKKRILVLGVPGFFEVVLVPFESQTIKQINSFPSIINKLLLFRISFYKLFLLLDLGGLQALFQDHQGICCIAS